MTLLDNKDRKILHDGINKQFNIWQKSEPDNDDINTSRRELINLVDTKKFPKFRELYIEDQWYFLCSLYCLYHSDTAKKSKLYNNSDIAKVNKEITGNSMEATIENVNTAG